MNMTKIIKNSILLALLALLLCLSAVAMFENNVISVRAEELSAVSVEDAQNEVSPQAWKLDVNVKLKADSTYVYAIATNDVTFPWDTVKVYVYLYSCTTYTEDISQMTLEAQTSITDLNMGQTLTAEKAINGRQLYWRGRTRYYTESNGWTEKQTDTHLVYSNGTMG